MSLLNNLIKEKFLQDTNLFCNKYQIEKESSPIGILIAHLACESDFIYNFFEIYIKYYKRQFFILELLAAKQGLEIHRQVFNLVRNHITRDNTNLTISHLIDLHNSYINQEIVYTLEKLI